MEEIIMSKLNLALVAKGRTYAHSCESEKSGLPYEKDCSKEIIDLHNKINRTAKSLLSMVIRVGELLTLKKQRLPHGQFTRWIKKNLPFSPRTAQNYMTVFRNKREIKSAKISVLSDAYKLVRLPRIRSNIAEKSFKERSFLKLSLYPEEKEWIDDALKKVKKLLETDSNSRALSLISYDWLMSTFDQKEIMPLEDALKSLERIYSVQLTIKRKTRK
jgi:hypothetical protein